MADGEEKQIEDYPGGEVLGTALVMVLLPLPAIISTVVAVPAFVVAGLAAGYVSDSYVEAIGGAVAAAAVWFLVMVVFLASFSLGIPSVDGPVFLTGAILALFFVTTVVGYEGSKRVDLEGDTAAN